jgi:hypothetical protein
MAYTGTVRFIMETNTRAIVEETESGASYPWGHKVLNADFSAKAREDSITYTYNVASAENDGRDITIS